MPSTLSANSIADKAFDEPNACLNVTEVGAAPTPYSAPADYSVQSILQRVFDDATETIRVVTV